MSEQNSAARGSRVKLSMGKLLSGGGGGGGGSAPPASCLLPPSIVTPVLRDVGKLAASVAAVNTSAKADGGDASAGGGGGGTLTTPSNSSGSATGNPRNKCALEPGHSLMDWIRLGNSGKDLTGVGELAGKMTVYVEEVLQHNTREDAWMVIRGNVYNVTEYLAFHPGGMPEIMRGVGIEDATALFDQVHPWVNYEKILTKCYIGRLGFLPPPPPRRSSKILSTARRLSTKSKLPDVLQRLSTQPDRGLIRFDWIQKHDKFMLFFYTGPYSNPYFEVRGPSDGEWTFIIALVERLIIYVFKPFAPLCPSPSVKVRYETGKVEVHFGKVEPQSWPTCGGMEQANRESTSQGYKKQFVVRERVILNETTFILTLEPNDGSIIVPPLGHDVWIYNDRGDAREYTPVPHFFCSKSIGELKTAFDSMQKTLVIRRLPKGRLSNFLFEKNVGDTVLGSESNGSFDLHMISDKQYFLFLAGGVGVTPFLSITQFLLEKKMKPAIKILLVNFNKNAQTAFLQDAFALMKEDKRFAFISVLTNPPESYQGYKGMLTDTMMDALLKTGFSDIPLADIFVSCCGPSVFNRACYAQITRLEIPTTNTHFFVSSTNQDQANRVSDSPTQVKHKTGLWFFRKVLPSSKFFCGCCPVMFSYIKSWFNDILRVLCGRGKRAK